MIVADTSFLFSIYGNDVNTARARSFLIKRSLVLTICEVTEFELCNALQLAEFRKILKAGEAALFWSYYQKDCYEERVVRKICNLSNIFKHARRLSLTYSLKGGHRGFDILHIASALEMKATHFLTFDLNQKKLAQAEGLENPL